MATYNDAQCDKHGIQWDSREIGMECPACEAYSEGARLLKLARANANDPDVLHQIKWYLGETDIPYHPMPEDMKDESERQRREIEADNEWLEAG